MVWYLLNVSLLIIIYLWPERTEQVSDGYQISKKKRKVICIVETITLALLSGLRHISIGPDTETYGIMFDRVKGQSWATLLRNFRLGYLSSVDISRDPGYPIFEKLVQMFTDEYQWFLMVIAALFFVALGVFIYRFSSNPLISYILFICLFFSFFGTTGHRQTVATAIIVLCGTIFIEKKKFFPFLILAFLASTLHMSSLCILPFYFMSRIKINKASLATYWIAIAGSFILRNQLLEFLQSLIGYENYQEHEGVTAGTFVYLLLALGIIVTLFHKKLLEANPKTMTMAINATMIACFFVPLMLINPTIIRIVFYFALHLMLILPELGKIFSKEGDRKIYRMAVVITLIALYISNEPKYQFFWQ